MKTPLRLSLSQPYEVVLDDVTYTAPAGPADPRGIFTLQFQMIPPETELFEAWANGTWDPTNPQTPAGPYSGRILVGPGQPGEVNPGVAGTFNVWARLYQASGETPTWLAGTIILSAP